MASARPVPVGQELVNSITAGPDLTAGFVAGAGQDGAVIGGQAGKLGQVYRTGDQFYVLLDRGLVPIGEVMARLLLAGGGEATEISASSAGVAQTNFRFEPEGFPYDMPRLRNTGTEPAMVCSAFRGQAVAGNALTTIELFDQADPRLAAASATVTTARIGPDGVRLADHVVIPGGRGALVRVLPAPDAPATNTTRYLVTDQGVKYALPRTDTDSVQDALGYGGVTATPVPSFLLALLPVGPALDPDEARLPASGVSPSASPTPDPNGSGLPAAGVSPSPGQTP
jgi:hypothetical protein